MKRSKAGGANTTPGCHTTHGRSKTIFMHLRYFYALENNLFVVLEQSRETAGTQTYGSFGSSENGRVHDSVTSGGPGGSLILQPAKSQELKSE